MAAKQPPKLRLVLTVEANTYLELAEAMDAATDGVRERQPSLFSFADEPVRWRYDVMLNPNRRAGGAEEEVTMTLPKTLPKAGGGP